MLKEYYRTFYLFCILCFCEVCSGPSPFPKLLVVSTDGFRHDYLHQVPTPNLHLLMKEGVHAPWMKNVYVTKTLPNHFSIMTGFYAESHGIVGNTMFDPVLNKSFSDEKTPEWWDNGHVMPILLANQFEDGSRVSGEMMWPGGDSLIRNMKPFYNTAFNASISFKERVDIVISWLNNEKFPANCVFLYFQEPDHTGHKFGPNSPEVRDMIKLVDNTIGYLIKKLKEAQLYELLNLIVLSDHGMTEVPDGNLIEMDSILDPSLYLVSSGSPVWNIRPVDTGNLDYIYNSLKNASKANHFKVYKKDEIPHEYHYKNNHRIMPILVEADEGWILMHNRSKSEGKKGSHGYNNSLPFMHPLFIARGPAFKVNFTVKPFNNVDLYPLMCHLLDIRIWPSNGTLENVFPMLNIRYDEPTCFSYFNPFVIGITAILVITVSGILIGAAVFALSKRNKVTSVDVHLETALPKSKEGLTSKEELKQLLMEGSEDEM
ncbi:ectonucleotide pyrophosphatase/phosphodiesterase family member 5-like [Tachypleus tridentatus]|uniref:ectonucleotide pyrophosphatase/phosphodiesterase family member 5-like n=1 Tax=Tachypleus tridentatus TaxID=6853 RepID=UPI003FD5BC28